MSNKEKHKTREKHEKLLLKIHKMADNCKSDCCEKYKKSEKKRCKRCPMFDLLKKYKKLSSV